MQRDKKRINIRAYLYSLSMGIWVTLFFAIPIAIIIVYSFLEKGLYGGVEWNPTLDAYKAILNPNFLIVIWRTVYISVIATAICILLAFPASYAMARSRHQTLFLFLIIIPFWTNSLIRVYAWINLLSTEGLINNVLIKLGIISDPIPMIYNLFSVILVLVYMYLPFAILPLFTAIDRFDFSLLDAARDLGCGRLRAIILVMFPAIRSGFFNALIFTLIPIFGAYTVPLLVGGMGSTMVGNIIVDQVQKTRNWPLASAFSVILTLISMIGVMAMLGSGKKKEEMNEKLL